MRGRSSQEGDGWGSLGTINLRAPLMASEHEQLWYRAVELEHVA
jgi:hypothetical protein